jgi:excisionase family DNA binding protein
VTKSTGENWFGVPALAEELGVTLRTVYRLLDSGELASYRIGRVIRVRRRDVEEFLERVKVRPGDLAHVYDAAEDDDQRRKR